MGKPATTDTREIIVEILLDLEKGQVQPSCAAQCFTKVRLSAQAAAQLYQAHLRGNDRKQDLYRLCDRQLCKDKNTEDEAAHPHAPAHGNLSDPVSGRRTGCGSMQ